jgi:magnesium transporter
MPISRIEISPEQRRRLSEGAPEEVAAALATSHEADIAEALNRIDPGRAAQIIRAFPFQLGVRVLEHPELERRYELFQHFPTSDGVAFVQAMSPDRQAQLFRTLPDTDRARFLEDLDTATRATLALLLAYPPTTAGGIMTTDYVSVPTTVTAGEALDHIAQVGRRKPVYAIYVLDPANHRLVHVISLRSWWSRIAPCGSWTSATTGVS